jgi:hypothetical protein
MYLFTVVINECSSTIHDTKGVIRNQKSRTDIYMAERKMTKVQTMIYEKNTTT